jgi:D-alanyl-D-alanine carboxypeptidase/D-alanyl-D-alanine-endopeptidase (penicillin-binding protein 4)
VRIYRQPVAFFRLSNRTKQNNMVRRILIIPSLLISLISFGQQNALNQMLSDSTMLHASVSLCIINAVTGETVADHDASKSFSQASVMKLVTTAAAIEMLGPGHTFTTTVGYSGVLKKGTLNGDIIIIGGGDPALGSERFAGQYNGFMEKWVEEIRKAGIRKITGRIITDDSYYDYQPVPPNWNWEDLGNYYGAGVYGLSIFDNTLKIHFSTGDTGTVPVITSFDPVNPGTSYVNHLKAYGSTDQGYVYSAPYNIYGWISGTIPANRSDFVLKASLTDPPLLASSLLTEKLKAAGIKVAGEPSTSRLIPEMRGISFTTITSTTSPELSAIIEVLTHESVNLYAEHLLKELGKVFGGEGSTRSGTAVVEKFLDTLGVEPSGMFIEDGSGLSPQDAVNSKGLASLLFQMKKKGKYFTDYYNSLPEAGKNGTLKNVFKDPVFEGAMRAKSGTILRVKSYAGYITAKSGNELIFSIIINNYTGPSSSLVAHISDILKETILNK